jgi:molecular chaperone GrpE
MSGELGPLDAAARERILRRFEAWLDETIAGEQPPRGIAAEILAEVGGEEEPPFRDLYSMWAAVTALTQEVRLQGRAFKQASASLEAAVGVRQAVEEIRELALQARAERERALEREAQRRARQELLEALLEARDRLARGLEVSRGVAPAGGRGEGLARLLAGGALRRREEALRALEHGYRLSLERLDEELDRLEVRPIAGAGVPFDARTMRAIEVEETGVVPEGTVLEVYRPGYEWRGEVVRPAEVKVSRAANDPGSSQEGE